MEGAVYLMSSSNAAEAELNLPYEYDFSNGKYECALIEVFLPNTQNMKLATSEFKILWYAAQDFDGFGEEVVKEVIPDSEMVFITETISSILPALSLLAERDLCEYMSHWMTKELKWNGKPPSLEYYRGFVNIFVASKIDSLNHVAIGFPLFDQRLNLILGITDSVEQIKNFLVDATSISSLISSSVANVNLDVFYNDVHFNAAKSIVPR